MNRLFDRYPGQRGYIVGTGPSILGLRASDFGSGPVLTINSAIVPVSRLGLKNPIFSMQKDGGNKKKRSVGITAECSHSGYCGNRCGGIFRPPDDVGLIVHDMESLNCFPDHPDRYVFSYKTLGFPCNTFSLAIAIRLLQRMGCNKLALMCCDAHAIGSYYRYDIDTGEIGQFNAYAAQRLTVKKELAGVNHEFFTPQGGKK